MAKKISLILIFLSIFFLTGCWNYNELNQLAICSGMAIDKENGEYKVSLMIANSKKYQVSSKEGESQKVVYSGSGKTVDDAVNKINLESPKKIYFGHLSIILVSDEVAKEGMLNIMDFLVRYPESTKRFLLAIAKDTSAASILKIISPLESYPSQDLTVNLKVASEIQSISTAVTFSKFMENYIKKGIDPILPTITVEGDAKDGSKSKSLEQATPDAIAKLGTLALFNDDKLVNFANETESKGINLLSGNTNKTIITTECKDKYMTTEIENISTSLKVEVKDNKPNVTLKFKGDASIEELMCDLDIRKTENIEKLNNIITSEIRKIILSGYKLAQDNKADIFGIGNLVYKNNPSYYNKIQNEWNAEIFPNIDLNIKIDLSIKSKGSLEQSIEEAKNGK